MDKVRLPNRPVGPFPVFLAGALVDGHPNYVTVGACGVVSLDPLLFVSLKSTHCTTRGVKETGFFSVNVPDTLMLELTDFCGLHSGYEVDKARLFTTFYGECDRAPLIKECAVNIVCEVVRSLEVNGFDLFLGEIREVYADGDRFTDDRLDPLKVDPILLMGNHYLQVGQHVGTPFEAGRSVSPRSLSR